MKPLISSKKRKLKNLKKYVSVYGSAGGYSKKTRSTKKASFHVFLEVVDESSKRFVEDKPLNGGKPFRSCEKANSYARKKAKKLKAVFSGWSGKQSAYIVC